MIILSHRFHTSSNFVEDRVLGSDMNNTINVDAECNVYFGNALIIGVLKISFFAILARLTFGAGMTGKVTWPRWWLAEAISRSP